MNALLNRALRCIGASFRLLLFIGSLMLALVSVAILAGWLHYRRPMNMLTEHQLWPRHYNTFLLVTAVYLFMLSLVACFSAFYRHKDLITLFSALSAGNVFLGILLLVLVLPGYEEISQTMRPRLKEARANYNWSRLEDSPYGTGPMPAPAQAIENNQRARINGITIKVGPNGQLSLAEATRAPTSADSEAAQRTDKNLGANATRLWDDIQSQLRCCGLDSSDEWLPVSPNHQSHPKSCCDEPKDLLVSPSQWIRICTNSTTFYQSNCFSRIQLPMATLLVFLMLAILASVILAVVGTVSIMGLH